ncbi:MFS transporter [Roseomonas sp. USHLN139]|uniref:MFS transporter n=1 Tax=Roseomonas sp. USHLN139 TaxID=3081298 RepID=UPI003B01C1DA
MAARGLQAFGDGYVAILLPVHLVRLGYSPTEVGLVATSTLLGSALLTLAFGAVGHRLRLRQGLLAAALLMAATGLGFGVLRDFWPLLVVAFVGTINPSGGDVSVFLPMEHTAIAQSVEDRERTDVFARYSFVGSIGAAVGALAIGALDWLKRLLPGVDVGGALFLLYGAIGLATLLIYTGLPEVRSTDAPPQAALGPSRRRVYGLAALFSVDAFGGGFIVNSLLALWLFERFGLSVATTGAIFFVTGICAALSYFVAARLAARFGLINTMVFTHLPSSAFLVLAAFAPTLPVAVVLLVLRSLLSQMDVPTRSSYVMAVVEPAERPAAASVTAVPRSLAASLSPALAGWMLATSPFGWPLVCAGLLKIVYDLALLRSFRSVRPPEEAELNGGTAGKPGQGPAPGEGR